MLMGMRGKGSTYSRLVEGEGQEEGGHTSLAQGQARATRGKEKLSQESVWRIFYPVRTPDPCPTAVGNLRDPAGPEPGVYQKMNGRSPPSHKGTGQWPLCMDLNLVMGDLECVWVCMHGVCAHMLVHVSVHTGRSGSTGLLGTMEFAATSHNQRRQQLGSA